MRCNNISTNIENSLDALHMQIYVCTPLKFRYTAGSMHSKYTDSILRMLFKNF
jgi:hypothetical protein